MTQAEYEARLRALERQLQADITLLQAAHAVRVRSLEKLRQAARDADAKDTQPLPPVQETAAAAPKRPPNQPRGAVLEDLERILPQLPDTFDRQDIDRLLGYRPMRSTLYRVLTSLEKEGIIETAQYSFGRQRVKYRKRKPQP